MSYSSLLKDQLLLELDSATLIGFLQVHAKLQMTEGSVTISFLTEKMQLARPIIQYIKEAYQLVIDIAPLKVARRSFYKVMIRASAKFLKELQLLTSDETVVADIPYGILSSAQKSRNYLKGVFIASGYIADPNKSYECIMTLSVQRVAIDIKDLLETLGVQFKLAKHANKWLVYSKHSEEIVGFLNLLGLVPQSLEYENIRIVKGMKNDINRMINFETANIDKTIEAAREIIECIEKIQNQIGIRSLPGSLQEIAILRQEYPELSLKELGGYCDPPISKSGVANRLKRLNDICKKLS